MQRGEDTEMSTEERAVRRPREEWQEPEEAELDPPGAFGGSTALPTPRFKPSSLQNCERVHFCCLRHLVCGDLLQEPLEINTVGQLGSILLFPHLLVVKGRM